jgi:hypothetical protein
LIFIPVFLLFDIDVERRRRIPGFEVASPFSYSGENEKWNRSQSGKKFRGRGKPGDEPGSLCLR